MSRHPLYEVSSHGRVRRTGDGALVREGWLARISLLFDHRPRMRITVAVLVLESFVGPRPHRHVPVHLDGTPLNNRLENVRWGSRSEMTHIARTVGPYPPAGQIRRPPVLTHEQIRVTRELHAMGARPEELARALGVPLRFMKAVLRSSGGAARSW